MHLGRDRGNRKNSILPPDFRIFERDVNTRLCPADSWSNASDGLPTGFLFAIILRPGTSTNHLNVFTALCAEMASEKRRQSKKSTHPSKLQRASQFNHSIVGYLKLMGDSRNSAIASLIYPPIQIASICARAAQLSQKPLFSRVLSQQMNPIKNGISHLKHCPTSAITQIESSARTQD